MVNKTVKKEFNKNKATMQVEIFKALVKQNGLTEREIRERVYPGDCVRGYVGRISNKASADCIRRALDRNLIMRVHDGKVYRYIPNVWEFGDLIFD